MVILSRVLCGVVDRTGARLRLFLPIMVPHKRKEPLKASPDWHKGPFCSPPPR